MQRGHGGLHGGSSIVFALAVAVMGLASSARADFVEAWGGNGSGQLGNGSTTNSNTPVAVSGLPSAVSAVAGGGFQSMAIQNGALYIWGYPSSITPVAINSLSSGVSAASGGLYHNLAIQNGAVYAWGLNVYGELGNANLSNDYNTIPVQVSGLSSVSAVSAGVFYSMAIQNGGVYAWGEGANTGIGNPDTSTPVRVSGLSSGVTAISAGYDGHNVAIQNGAVVAWGANSSGELGNGNTTYSGTPVSVIGLSSGVSAIAAGGFYSLALLNGGVYAWGNNNQGQLGNGNNTEGSSIPIRVDPADLTGIIAIAASLDSSYALSSDGSLWVWGDNYAGELGLGTTQTRIAETIFTPQHLLPPAGYKFTSIESSSTSSHVLATLAPVPEPTSLGLLGLGISGFVRKRRRFRAVQRTYKRVRHH